jgi:hypothetical protein
VLPYAEELNKLLRYLKALPQTLPVDNQYDFIIEPTPEELEEFAGAHGVINRALECVFPGRSKGPVSFKCRGPNLETVVPLLRRHITGMQGQNMLLTKWVDDLTAAAEAAITAGGGTVCTGHHCLIDASHWP